MRILLGMMLVVMVLPMVASSVVLLDQNFDGVVPGMNLETLGWEPTEYVVSSNTIDVGNSASGPGGGEAVYMFNHTLGAGQYYQIDAVTHGNPDASYFWLQNAAGNDIFFNHAIKWVCSLSSKAKRPQA